jgi:hypothetical protein
MERLIEMSPLTSFVCAFVAYIPLWIIVSIKDVFSILYSDGVNCVAEYVGVAILLCLSVGCGAISFLFSRNNFDSSSPMNYRIVSCFEKKTVTIRFVVENVLPLLAFDPTTAEGLSLLFAYFLIVSTIAVRHRHFPPNPFFEWLGWTMYECKVHSETKTEFEKTVIVISRKYLGGVNKTCQLCKLNDETFVFKGDISK